VREHPPGAAAAGEVEDRVDDFAGRVLAGPAALGAIAFGEPEGDIVPLEVGEVAGIARPCVHAESVAEVPKAREGQFLDGLLVESIGKQVK
jgi:hypothetical protein